MKKTVIIILIILLGTSCEHNKNINEYYSARAKILDVYYLDLNKKNYKVSLNSLKKAFPLFKYETYFYIASSSSDKDSIVQFLNKSINSGFYDSFKIADYFEKKLDSNTLNHLIQKSDSVREKKFALMKNRKIAKNLYQMYKDDQSVRKHYIEEIIPNYSKSAEQYKNAQRQILKTDSINKAKLINILQELNEWPRISDFDEQVSTFAFYFYQHGDNILQEKYFSDMSNYVEIDEVKKRDYAFMLDRYNMRNEDEQIFGTQFRRKNDTVFVNYPIANHLILDSLRLNYGLTSMKSHLKRINKSKKRIYIYEKK